MSSVYLSQIRLNKHDQCPQTFGVEIVNMSTITETNSETGSYVQRRNGNISDDAIHQSGCGREKMGGTRLVTSWCFLV